MMPRLRQSGVTSFEPLPVGQALTLAWPTLNQTLFSQPDRFLSVTRANPNYGKPGWTRDCGKRFHRGCDIAALRPQATGLTTQVWFTDCARELEYPSDEPTFTVDEAVFAVAEGRVHEVNGEADRSELGQYVVLAHQWPGDGSAFYTLYAHLAQVAVVKGASVRGGMEIGLLGQTSASADARNWMAIAPHLHFEVWNEVGQAYDPLQFLVRWLAR